MAAKNREELLNLIPAYALGALDEDERAEFEAWLRNDTDAQTILADYRSVADHLVALAPFRPAPDHLRADLRQRLAASRRARRAGRILALAALFAVVILGALLIRFGLTDDSKPTPDAAELYAQLEAQPGSSQYAVVPGDVDPAVAGSLVVSPDGDQAVLRLSSLPEIATDQTFQMWLVDEDGARTSGGLFQADPAQQAIYIQVPFERPVTAYRGVGVSLEPAGGSPFADQPTGPRVLSIPLS